MLIERTRGFAPGAIANSTLSVTRFLKHLGYDADPARLETLTSNDIEAFIRERGQYLRRTACPTPLWRICVCSPPTTSTGAAPSRWFWSDSPCYAIASPSRSTTRCGSASACGCDCGH